LKPFLKNAIIITPMGVTEAVVAVAVIIAILGGVFGIFAALVGHLLDED